MRSTTLLFTALFATACIQEAVEQTDPGTQIGGVDCDNNKLLLNVVDAQGAAVESQVSVGFPSGDILNEACSANGCNLELEAAIGTYTLSVDAGASGSRSTSFVLDASTKVGTLSADCGGTDLHELTKTVEVVVNDGGGDIFTSNIGVHPLNSAGDPEPGDATITDRATSTPWTVACVSSRCWVDIDGMGTYDIDYVGNNGEKGSATIVVDRAHFAGVNEVGDDTYEADVTVTLAP